MSNRFHSKYHRQNHHTYSSSDNPDAGHDPIASPEAPFQGPFVINGTLSAVAPLSASAGFFKSNNTGVVACGNVLGADIYGNTCIHGNLTISGSINNAGVSGTNPGGNYVFTDGLQVNGNTVKVYIDPNTINIANDGKMSVNLTSITNALCAMVGHPVTFSRNSYCFDANSGLQSSYLATSFDPSSGTQTICYGVNLNVDNNSIRINPVSNLVELTSASRFRFIPSAGLTINSTISSGYTSISAAVDNNTIKIINGQISSITTFGTGMSVSTDKVVTPNIDNTSIKLDNLNKISLGYNFSQGVCLNGSTVTANVDGGTIAVNNSNQLSAINVLKTNLPQSSTQTIGGSLTVTSNLSALSGITFADGTSINSYSSIAKTVAFFGENHTSLWTGNVVTSDNRVIMWGNNRFFSRSDNASIWPPMQIPFTGFYNFSLPVNTKVIKMITTRAHSMVLFNDGTLWFIGVDALGNWNYVFQKIAISAFIVDFETSSHGSYDWPNTAAIDSSGKLYTWGTNYYGELGHGTWTYWQDIKTPTGFESGVKQVVMTRTSLHVLKTDGTLWSSGGNYYAQFSNGTGSPAQTTNTLVVAQKSLNNDGNLPGAVFNNITKIFRKSTSCYESLYVYTADDSVYAVGLNDSGQLGVGNNTNRNLFMKIATFTSGVVDMAIYGVGSYTHCMAYTSNGTVYTWGYNGYGPLGFGNDTNKNTPTVVSSLADITPARLLKYGIDSNATNSAFIGTDGYLYLAGWRALTTEQWPSIKDYVTNFARVPVPNVVDAQAMTAINHVVGWLIKDKNNKIYMICGYPSSYLTGPVNIAIRHPADVTNWFV